MNVINLYTSEKYEEMVEAFKLINPDVLDGEEALAAYKAIADFIPSNKCMDQFFKRALDSFNSGKFQPMGANMGILPGIDLKIKDKKKYIQNKTY